MRKPLLIQSLGMPPGVDAYRNPICQALAEAAGRKVLQVQRGQIADLQVTSSFGDGVARATTRALAWSGRRLQRWGFKFDRIPVAPRESRGVPRLWWTGENLRPPAGNGTSLSFDTDAWNGSNFYWPLWHMLLSDEWSHPFPNFTGVALVQRCLLQGRGVDPPNGFVAAVLGNVTDERLQAIQALSALGQVDVYGKAVGRPVPSKAILSGRYKFVLAFENDLFPGYVTEKPIEAWSLGSVPIYWGLDPKGFLNEEAMICWSRLGTHAALDEIQKLNVSTRQWKNRASAPILARPFPRGELIAFLHGQLAKYNLV